MSERSDMAALLLSQNQLHNIGVKVPAMNGHNPIARHI